MIELMTAADIPAFEFAHSWVAIAMAAVGVAGALIDNMAQDDAKQRELDAYGREKAAHEMNTVLAVQQSVDETAKVEQQAQAAEIQIEQNADAVQAQREVNAAAAGIEGNSVDVTVEQADWNAGTQLGGVRIQRDNTLNMIAQATRDTKLSRSGFTQMKSGNNTLSNAANVFGAGIMGYLGNR